MYSLVTLADVVEILPSNFNKPSYRAIEDWINAKYANKVIHKIGLCVGFHSLLSSSDGLIGHGTGTVHVNVDFRLIVFRPFKGEILRGKILQSTPVGVSIANDFFDEFTVPPQLLFPNTVWDKDEDGKDVYIWQPNGVGGGVFYYDKTEQCMIRVEEEVWNDLSPHLMKAAEDEMNGDKDHAPTLSPYSINASMMQEGLGLLYWWGGEQTPEEAIAREAEVGPEQATEMVD